MVGVVLTGAAAWALVVLVAVWAFCAGYGVCRRAVDRELVTARRERRRWFAAAQAADERACVAEAEAAYWRAEVQPR